MLQDSYPQHFSARNGDPRHREVNRVAIYTAVQAICAQRGVDEAAAYTILVQAAVEAESSIREAASRIVAVPA